MHTTGCVDICQPSIFTRLCMVQDCLSSLAHQAKTTRAQTWQLCTLHVRTRGHHHHRQHLLVRWSSQTLCGMYHMFLHDTEEALDWLDTLVMHLDQMEGFRESCLCVMVLGAQRMPVPWPVDGHPLLVPRRWHVAPDGQASYAQVCTHTKCTHCGAWGTKCWCENWCAISDGITTRSFQKALEGVQAITAPQQSAWMLHEQEVEVSKASWALTLQRLPAVVRCVHWCYCVCVCHVCRACTTQAGHGLSGECARCPGAGREWLCIGWVFIARACIQAWACRQVWRLNGSIRRANTLFHFEL